MTFAKAEHPLNISVPNFVTLAGTSMLVKAVIFSKAASAKVVKEEGKLKLVKAAFPLKASPSIVVKAVGRLISFKALVP